jgi:hypothetical protein
VASGTHRPADEEYWVPSWSRVLFSGDVFEAIPFAGQPTMVVADEEQEQAKHYIGELAFAYGLLVSPTCDMYEQLSEEPRSAHPYRVLVPILPLEAVAESVQAVERSVGLLRSRDSIVPYMYLPPLGEVLEAESVACLFRPTLVSDDFLREPPRRVAQMHPEARRQLKIKLARYWARVDVNRDALPLYERDEEDARSDERPSSVYDAQ